MSENCRSVPMYIPPNYGRSPIQDLLDMREEIEKQILRYTRGAVPGMPRPLPNDSPEIRFIVMEPTHGFNMTLRAEMDISMRQVIAARGGMHDLIADSINRLQKQIEFFVEKELMTVDLEKVVADAVKTELRAEVKRQVTEAVESKIDEFVEGALS